MTRSRGAAWLSAGVLLLTGLVVAPSASADGLDEQQQAWLDAHGPVRYGYEPFYAPFEFADEQGDPVGINFDLLDAMARNLGFQIEKVRYDNFTALQDALRAGEIDVLGSINKTDERDAWLDFSQPYVRLASVFYVTDRHPDVKGIDDLEGLRVGIIGSYVSGQWLGENHPDLSLSPYDDLDLALQALATGEIDALFEESATVGFMVRENAYTNIRVLDAGAFLQSDQHWVVLEGRQDLVDILDAGMASISPGDQTKIFEYWTGYDLGVTEPAQIISETARNIIIAIAVALAAAMAGSLLLRHQVKARTADLRGELARRRVAEEKVHAMNRELEQRVEQRTSQLRRSNQDLQQFAHVISHDLQNPLNAMGLHLGILARGQLDPKQTVAVGKVADYAQRMRDLIQATLEFARSTGEAPMQRTDLRIVLEAAQSDLEADVRATGARVEIGEMPDVHGNPMQLKRLFANLLSNAIKYRRPDVEPVVKVTSERRDGGWAIHVQDNGTGFEGDASDLLGLFVRRHHDVEGHGIGLASCARIAAHHSGRLDGQSRPGHGSTFTVHLPA